MCNKLLDACNNYGTLCFSKLDCKTYKSLLNPSLCHPFEEHSHVICMVLVGIKAPNHLDCLVMAEVVFAISITSYGPIPQVFQVGQLDREIFCDKGHLSIRSPRHR
jgi:hypothetical protein